MQASWREKRTGTGGSTGIGWDGSALVKEGGYVYITAVGSRMDKA